MSKVNLTEKNEEEINWYKKSMIKRSIFTLLVVLVICCATGCGLIREPESGIEVEAQMIEYLEKKYNQKFEILYVSYGDFLHPEIRMAAYPEGGDSEIDRFEIIREKVDGKNVFKDGYYKIWIREEYEEYVREVVEKYFPNCKFYTSIMETTLDSSLTKEVSIEEAFEIQSLPLAITVFVVEDDKSEYVTSFDDFCSELLILVPDATAIFIGLEQEDFNNLCRQNSEDDIYDLTGNALSKINFYLRSSWWGREVEE